MKKIVIVALVLAAICGCRKNQGGKGQLTKTGIENVSLIAETSDFRLYRVDHEGYIILVGSGTFGSRPISIQVIRRDKKVKKMEEQE